MARARNAVLGMMSWSNSNDDGWMPGDKMTWYTALCQWLHSVGPLTFSGLNFEHCSSVYGFFHSQVLFVPSFLLPCTHSYFFYNEQLLNKNLLRLISLSGVLIMVLLHTCSLQSHAWGKLNTRNWFDDPESGNDSLTDLQWSTTIDHTMAGPVRWTLKWIP